MSRLKISDPAKELTYFRKPLEGWLRLDNCDDGHFPLVFILAPPEAPSQVLLGRKKRGFGRDRINGFGGKLEPGETLSQCAVREVAEECGLAVNEEALEKGGEIVIVRQAATSPLVAHIHLYVVRQWAGQVAETDEMVPAWYNLAMLPWSEMWPEARMYLPALLEPHAPRFITGRVDYRDPESPCGWWFQRGLTRDAFL